MNSNTSLTTEIKDTRKLYIERIHGEENPTPEKTVVLKVIPYLTGKTHVILRDAQQEEDFPSLAIASTYGAWKVPYIIEDFIATASENHNLSSSTTDLIVEMPQPILDEFLHKVVYEWFISLTDEEIVHCLNQNQFPHETEEEFFQRLETMWSTAPDIYKLRCYVHCKMA